MLRPVPDVFTCIDLELNQDPITGPRIIQIGFVIGSLSTGIILSQGSILINPQQQLLPFITQLTGITQEQVDGGITLLEGYEVLRGEHEKYDSFCNPITWGGGDLEAIRKELEYEAPRLYTWAFGRRWIDAKTLYVSWRIVNGKMPAGGLAKAMTNLGLSFKGKKHQAMDDALNTFTIYRKLCERLMSSSASMANNTVMNLPKL